MQAISSLTVDANVIAYVSPFTLKENKPYPYYIRDRQSWAVDQARQNHREAIYYVGEMCVFVLMWHIEDFNAGYVTRCARCYLDSGVVGDAYGQPRQNKCPDCFGTTFEGGYRALIYRPAIFTDTDEGEQFDAKGVIHPTQLTMETTTDFRARSGDYVMRLDGSRWFMRIPARTTLRSGFGHPFQQVEAVTYNEARVQLEDPTSVAYNLPPDNNTLTTILASQRYAPDDLSQYETRRAPLIPPYITDVIGD